MLLKFVKWDNNKFFFNKYFVKFDVIEVDGVLVFGDICGCWVFVICGLNGGVWIFNEGFWNVGFGWFEFEVGEMFFI